MKNAACTYKEEINEMKFKGLKDILVALGH